MTIARRSHVVAAALLAALSGACVIGYEVTVTNRLDVPVVLELSQYHAADHGHTPPMEFTPDLLIETRNISLRPGERAKVQFNSASGGFWVRWRQVEPATSATEASTLNLIRDRLTIDVSEASTDHATQGERRSDD